MANKSFLHLFQMDVARWIRPEQVAELSEVNWANTFKLLFRHMPLRAMAWFRFASWAKHVGIPGIPGAVQRRIMRHYGLEISSGAEIGGGLYIAHPVGTTIAVEKMGENVSIIANVTVGMRGERRWPRIGDHTFIGAGARVLGNIDLGEAAVVGANAVVLKDVPAGATVVGIPAKIVRQKKITDDKAPEAVAPL